MQESAFFRMIKVLAIAFGLSLAIFSYSVWICGALGIVGLMLAAIVFGISVFGGVVLYLE